MTVSVTKLITVPFLSERGIKKVLGVFKLEFSDTYSTGGDTVNLAPYLRKIDCIVPIPDSGYIFEPDESTYSTPSAVKIKVIQPTRSQTNNLAATVTVPAYTDSYAQSGTYDVSFSGTKGDVDAGPGEELADGASYPSGLTCYILVFGS